MSSILKSSDAARLALHAAVRLGQEPGTRQSVGAMAREFGVSAAHLAKVLGRLERAGLVLGTRGPAGGYVLARPARLVSLAQVFEAVEGPLSDRRCPFDVPVCDGNGCLLGGYFRVLNRKAAAKLNRTKLSNVHLKLGGKK